VESSRGGPKPARAKRSSRSATDGSTFSQYMLNKEVHLALWIQTTMIFSY